MVENQEDIDKGKEEDEKILLEAMERFKMAEEAESRNRVLALEDIRFVHDDDAQWTEEAKTARKGRPCMTFDHTSSAIDQVIGDYLQNRPGVKVRGLDDGTDQDLADIYTGLIRNIESGSSASSAYKTAFKFAISGGYGVWRITTDYEHDLSFDQNINVSKVPNPFTILFDPSALETCKQDGVFAFESEVLPDKEFKVQYPDAKHGADTEGTMGEGHEGWYLESKTRIARYWRKKPTKKTILKLSSGEVVDKSEVQSALDDLALQGITVKAEREVDSHVVEWFKMTGKEILERGVWAGKYIPLVPVFGKTINIEGENKYRGAVRKAKDPQRSYNYHRSQTIEVLALQPKAPFMATPAMLTGFNKQWETINTSNAPVILYNPDPNMPGSRPSREAPPAFPSGLLQEGLTALDDIKSATNIHDASLGARSNETSGRAIRERKLEGDTANYEYTDNFNEALELSGKILVDLIPKIYDTERAVRILGEDGSEKFERVNKVIVDAQSGLPVKINDLQQGRYDVAVSAGASYTTKRTETAEQLTEVMKFNPALGEVLSDLWVKSLDLVGGEEAVKRIRKTMIMKGIVDPTEEEKKEMPQQQPDPKQEALMQLQVEKLRSEIENKDADTLKKKAEAENVNIDAAMKELQLAVQTGNQQVQQMALMQLIEAMTPQNQNPTSGLTGP